MNRIGAGEVRKFLLLVLPSRAEIPLEMGIFFQLRVGVRREHLAVRIDCDAAASRLLQQELQVVQIMAGHNDERAGLHGKRHMDRGRLAEAFGVGFVQQRHAAQVDLAQLQHERQQLLHAPVLADGKQSFRKEALDGLVPVAEHHGVVRIGRHAAAAEQQQGLQAADVLLCAPELRQIIVARPAAGRGADGTVRHKALLLGPDAPGQGVQTVRIEIDVRQRGEQAFDHQLPGLRTGIRAGVRRARQTDQCSGQPVLHLRSLRVLAADAAARAAGAACGLLTLKAKHVVVHGKTPSCGLGFTSWTHHTK